MPQQRREEFPRDRIPLVAKLQDVNDFLRQFRALGAVFLREAGDSELHCMVDENHARDVRLVSEAKM
jgi:hypothetical protein